jgi:hypothetical protein
VNFAVASWQLGQRRDAAQAMHHALSLMPGLEAATLNYSLMLRTVGQLGQARGVLDAALLHDSPRWRLQLAIAEIARLQGETAVVRTHALAAIAAFPLELTQRVAPVRQASKLADSGDRVERALHATAAALDAAGIPFHLVGGTLLGIHRDGRPFPHDKDIDLGVPFECDRASVEAALACDFTPMLAPGHPQALASTQWTMGFVHEMTGIGVDLFFVEQRGNAMYNEVGWPDHLASEVQAYGLRTLHWHDRDWWIPDPVEGYLEGMYGPSWREPIRYFDTQLSSPSCTAEAMPRAINLALLRLLHALQANHHEQAQALCRQLQAREPLAEVQAVAAALSMAIEA